MASTAAQKKEWQNRIVDSGEMPANQFLAHEANARRHPAPQRDALRGSLNSVGWVAPVIVSKRSGKILDGHARVEEALSKNDESLVPYVAVDVSEAEEKLILASFDPITDLAEYDKEALDALLREVNTGEAGLRAMLAGLASENDLYFSGASGADHVATDKGLVTPKVTLADRFIIPPFSVLDARQGYWQDRKRAWLALGIQSELGRGDTVLYEAEQVTTQGLNYDSNLAKGNNGLLGESQQARSHYKNAAPGGSLRDAMTLNAEGKTERGDGKGKPLKGLARCFGQDLMRGEHEVGATGGLTFKNWSSHPRYYEQKTAAEEKLGRKLSNEEFEAQQNVEPQSEIQSGTSIFDPVLCELAYRWFSSDGAKILDPFAGGSVRGIVASKLGRSYTGIDLRKEQVQANVEQAKEITPEGKPKWVVGDSRQIKKIAKGQYDLLFTCPPYADLEVYSDDPADISTLPYDEFIAAYRQIITDSLLMLRDDRFAVIVVGDVRDKKGIYRNFVSHTIDIFQAAGAMLYNEAILVTSVGSLPIRVGRQFEAGRKLGKTHQNVLAFVKGDARRATQFCGKIDVYDPASEFGEVQ